MAKGKPGADSSVLVTNRIGDKGLIELATALYGEAPVFWGRYFTSASAGGNVEYRHLKENQPLRDNNIRVLPIARQTNRVSGTHSEGSADAEKNADDLLATFGADYPQTLTAHSSSQTSGEVEILPCVYAVRSDTPTWSAIAAAVLAGAACNGAWIARWPSSGCQPLPEWDAGKVTPDVAIPCPILIWQYANDCHGGGGFDCSETNPGIDLQSDLLDQLVLPPDMTAVT